MDKTLGQIAFEAPPKRFCEWEDISPEYQKEWEHVAAAVASAVKEEDARICDEEANHAEKQQTGSSFDQVNVMLRHHIAASDRCADAIRASIKEVK